MKTVLVLTWVLGVVGCASDPAAGRHDALSFVDDQDVPLAARSLAPGDAIEIEIASLDGDRLTGLRMTSSDEASIAVISFDAQATYRVAERPLICWTPCDGLYLEAVPTGRYHGRLEIAGAGSATLEVHGADGSLIDELELEVAP